jgi:cell division protein FtsI/penicillin-binding protein 2
MKRSMIVFQIAAIIFLCVFIYFSAKMIVTAYQKIVKVEQSIAADTLATEGEYTIRITDRRHLTLYGVDDCYTIEIDRGDLTRISDHDVVKVKRYLNRAIKKTQDFSAR